MGLSLPRISTNVRTQSLRLGLRVLQATRPELAATLATSVFFSSARRHRRPAWESSVLASARAFRVPHAGSHLPAWEWGAPDAESVLLVHGWEGRGSQLGAFVAPLVAQGLRVVAFDGPGHGDSPSRQTSVVHHALAVERMLNAVGPVRAIVAHSVGGAASALALRWSHAPRPGLRCVFVAPPVSPARFEGAFGDLLGLDRATRGAVRERVEARLAVRFDELDVRRGGGPTDVPMLLVHDEEDLEVPYEDGRAFAAAWPGAEVLTTSGLGHRRILRDPRVIRATAAFVRDAHLDAEAKGLWPGSLESDLFYREDRALYGSTRSEPRTTP